MINNFLIRYTRTVLNACWLSASASLDVCRFRSGTGLAWMEARLLAALGWLAGRWHEHNSGRETEQSAHADIPSCNEKRTARRRS